MKQAIWIFMGMFMGIAVHIYAERLSILPSTCVIGADAAQMAMH